MRPFAGLTRSRRPNATRRRVLITATSSGLHLALLAILALNFTPAPRLPTDHEVEVHLVPADAPRRLVSPTHHTKDRTAPKDTGQPGASAPAISQLNAGRAPRADTPPAVPQASAGPDARLVAALRGSVGCDSASFLHLSPAERAACEQAARRFGTGFASANLGVDSSKRLEFEAAAKRDLSQQPFLALKPKNGCVPRLTSTSDLPGRAAQDTTAGVACALSF